DGTQTSNPAFQPCVPSANVTHCCRTGETCLKSGLCLAMNHTSLNSGLCTDSTWQDQACFLQCVNSYRAGPSTVYRCNNNNWCCADGVANSTSCCQDKGVGLFPILKHAAVENGSAFIKGY
ncbi:hypothetical protein A1O7_02007, partial [Cladophialophora yegresii CBS 114405]